MTHEHPFMKVLEAAGLYKPEMKTTRPDLSGLPSASAGDPRARQYALKALEYEATDLANAVEHTRNDTLNRAAFKLGSLVAAGHLKGQEVMDELTASARKCGLPLPEINRTASRAARDGSRDPRDVKLEPSEEIKPAHTLNVAPPMSEGHTTNGHVPTENDQAENEYIASVVARYPRLDWAAVFAQSPEDVQWIVYPLFERGRLYSLYSPAKAGKSLFALDVCAAMATGRSVLGQPPSDPLIVLYVDLENSPMDLVERLQDLGYGPDELDHLVYLSFPSMPALDSRVGGDHLLAVATHYQADVVVIDTVSRMIQGGENDSDTFHSLYRHAMAPLKALGVTVIRLDHSGKDEERGMRGSSAKVSDVDVAWKLTRTGEEGRLRLDRTASRNSHSPDYVVIDQQDEPLQHLLVDDAVSDDVARILHTLDDLGIPTDWGAKRIRQKLTEAGRKVGDHKLREAIRIRKTTFWEQS